MVGVGAADGGKWECLVTPSGYEKNDALKSRPAFLVVRGGCLVLIIYIDKELLRVLSPRGTRRTML